MLDFTKTYLGIRKNYYVKRAPIISGLRYLKILVNLLTFINYLIISNFYY